MDDFVPEGQTPAMCKAWRLFRDHGRSAESIVEAEIMQCLRTRDTAGAAEWREVAEALNEWCQ
jgi:hypothetical protein